MKKRRLRKWVKIVIIIIVAKTFIDIVSITIENYKNDLEECDRQNNYTCNIFGK